MLAEVGRVLGRIHCTRLRSASAMSLTPYNGTCLPRLAECSEGLFSSLSDLREKSMYVHVTSSYFFLTGFWYFRSLVSSRSRRGSCRRHCRIYIRNGTFHAIVCAQSPIAFRLYVHCIAFFSASASVVVCLLRFSRCPLTLNEGA